MSAIIKQIKEKIKSILKILETDLFFYSSLIILSSSISFLLGSLYQYQKNHNKEINKIQLLKESKNKKIYYVASKHGKRYYLPWCYTGSTKNKIIFQNQEEAKKAGYTPAKSCPEILEIKN